MRGDHGYPFIGRCGICSSLRSMLASVDGAIGPAEEARIPVTDEGLTRGDGGFEVMRLYGGRPFAYDDHMARLVRTCAGPPLPYHQEAPHAVDPPPLPAA